MPLTSVGTAGVWAVSFTELFSPSHSQRPPAPSHHPWTRPHPRKEEGSHQGPETPGLQRVCWEERGPARGAAASVTSMGCVLFLFHCRIVSPGLVSTCLPLVSQSPREEVGEREAGLFKILAFGEDGELPSTAPLHPLSRSEDFIGR